MNITYSTLTEQREFQLRPVSTADRPPLATAFAQAFGRGRAGACWDAIYDQSPDGSLGSIAIETAPARVVAHYGGTVHLAQGRDYPEGISVVQTRDAFSDAEARGRQSGRRSVFVQTAQHFFKAVEAQQIALAIGFGSSRHARLGMLTLGYQSFEALHRLVMPAAVSGQGPKALPMVGWLQPASPPLREFDEFWRQRRRNYGLAIARTGRFMAWRFGKVLGRGARIFVYRSYLAPGILGYAVTRQAEDRCLILDVAFPPQPYAIGDFWNQLQVSLDLAAGTPIETWCCDHAPEYEIWRSLGFMPQRMAGDIVPAFRICNSGLDPSWVRQNLVLTMADADIV